MSQQDGYNLDMGKYRSQVDRYKIKLKGINEIDETYHRVSFQYGEGKESNIITMKKENVNDAVFKAIKRDERFEAHYAKAQ